MNYWTKSLAAVCLFTASGMAQSIDNPEVTLHTNKGDIRIELYVTQAPGSAENFLQYARDGYYDGTVFHRVISDFMIQGGGFTPDLRQKPTRSPIANEADNGLRNLRGTVAMARTNNVDSATSQFFINVEANPALDHKGKDSSRTWGYTVFGVVVDGMKVVDDIRFAKTATTTGMANVPMEPIVIESVTIH